MPTEINGIKTTDLLKMVSECREKWGDETFGRALGILMTIGNDIELLEAVEKLIETKNKKDESK